LEEIPERMEFWNEFDEFISLKSKQSFFMNECVNLNNNMMVAPEKNCQEEVKKYFNLSGMEKLPQIVEECEHWLNSFPRIHFPNPKKIDK